MSYNADYHKKNYHGLYALIIKLILCVTIHMIILK